MKQSDLTAADERAIAQRATRRTPGDIGKYTAAYEQSRRDVLRLLDELRRVRAEAKRMEQMEIEA